MSKVTATEAASKHELKIVLVPREDEPEQDDPGFRAALAALPDWKELTESADDLGTPECYLQLAVAIAMAYDDPHRAHVVLDLAGASANLQDEVFWRLRSAVLFHIAWCQNGKSRSQIGKDEKLVVQWFDEHLPTLIPDAAPAKRPKNTTGHGTPDRWVMIDEKLRPVEMKDGPATAASMAQALGYVRSYGSDHGYLVASRLSCQPDPLITFIQAPTSQQLRAD